MAGRSEHDVGRFQIAMHQATLVGVGQAVGRLGKEAGRNVWREWPAGCYGFVKSFARHIFQRDVMYPLGYSSAISTSQMRVIDLFGDFHLSAKAHEQSFFFSSPMRRQDLQRNRRPAA